MLREEGYAHNVVLVSQGQAPLAVNTVRAVVPGDGGVQPVGLVILDGLLHVRLGLTRRVFDLHVVAGGEDHSVATHGVAHLGNFLQRYRMWPQVFHPNALSVPGLGQLFAQLVAVGTHHVLDVGSSQVRNQRMDVVDVVLVGGEQVPFAFEARHAVCSSGSSTQGRLARNALWPAPRTAPCIPWGRRPATRGFRPRDRRRSSRMRRSARRAGSPTRPSAFPCGSSDGATGTRPRSRPR